MSDEPQGGRIFFSSAGRTLEGEDEIRLTSVGVDIGSSTSHLVFSRLLLERLDNRYVVTEREVFHESAVLLTPYAGDQTIDALELGAFLEAEYNAAGVDPSAVDTGALILTGVAVRRRNARAIGELFAAEIGKFVAVSAGDGLEARLSAYGSGAVARSIRDRARVMNIDVGGGTSKIAVCDAGDIVELTAIDIGARVICLEEAGRVTRIEEAGKRFAAEFGLDLDIGSPLAPEDAKRIAARMADRLFEAVSERQLSAETAALLRLDPLRNRQKPEMVTFSGGVSEYIYGREQRAYGDLGQPLAAAIRKRIEGWGVPIETPEQGIRATVVGASQYTVQVSGSTIYVTPSETLPLRNVPVIVPDLPLEPEDLVPADIARAIERALRRNDLADGEQPVALCFHWQGSATYRRLDDFCKGVTQGLRVCLDQNHPLVLVNDGDVGGLIGIHAHEETKLEAPIVSIDGVELEEFDFIDIGAVLEASGAVPVVIKSLVFPISAALGRVEAEPIG
jgi:ethanolamine utilization protein EutA